MTPALKELVERLEAWPVHADGADYSVEQLKAQQAAAAQAIRQLCAEVDRQKLRVEIRDEQIKTERRCYRKLWAESEGRQ